MNISGFTKNSLFRGVNLRSRFSLGITNSFALRSSNGRGDLRNINLALKGFDARGNATIASDKAISISLSISKSLARNLISILLRTLYGVLFKIIRSQTNNSRLRIINSANRSNSIIRAIGTIKVKIGLFSIEGILEIGNLRNAERRNIAFGEGRARNTNLTISFAYSGNELTRNSTIVYIESFNFALRFRNSFRLRGVRGSNGTIDCLLGVIICFVTK